MKIRYLHAVLDLIATDIKEKSNYWLESIDALKDCATQLEGDE